MLQLYATDMAMPTEGPPLFFDVGANKGYNIAAWTALWMPQLGVNSRTLGEFLRTKLKSYCGACEDCKDRRWEHLKFTERRNQTMEIHAFEPQPSTFALLNEVQQWMNASIMYTHNLALSNETGTILQQKCSAGNEVCALARRTHPDQMLSKFVVVNVTTLDRVVELQNISRRIDVLKIDTEGFDPLVIQGAQQILRRQQVRLLLFEYHGIGAWRMTTLKQVLIDLDTKGYQCYQAGQTGVFRLTGCWSSKFEVKRWSNVLCVSRREPRLIQSIEQLRIKREHDSSPRNKS